MPPLDMKHTRRTAGPWPVRTVLLAALILPGMAFAQISRTANVTGVDITMALDKTKIMVGEPLIFTITMENVSAAPTVELSANFQLSEGNGLEINVQPPGELKTRYTGGLQSGVYSATPVSLAKGAPKSVQTLLLFDRNQPSGLLFSKPGTYELTAKLDFSLRNDAQRPSVSLPTTQIEVTEPTGAQAKVLAALDRPEYILGIHLGATPTTGMLSLLSDVGQRFPATGLGALALRAEGLNYTRSSAESDREKGAGVLQDYLAHGVELFDADAVVWQIAASYHRNKSYDVAREWVFYLARNYPWSTRLRMEDTLVGYYYLDPAIFAGGAPWYLFKAPWILPGTEPPTDLKPRESK